MSTLPLNVKQKRVAFGTVAVLILMFLCPPWYERSQSQMYHEDSSLGLRGSSDRTHGMGLPLFHESFNGYHWLFKAPRGRFDYDQETVSIRTYKGTSSGYHIAWGILFLQWLLVCLAGLALVHRYRDKIQLTPETMTTTDADKSNQGENRCSHVTPEIIIPNLEAEPTVEKDSISAKKDIDNSSTTIIVVVGLAILLVIGISIVLSHPNPNYNNKVNFAKDNLAGEMQEFWKQKGIKTPEASSEANNKSPGSVKSLSGLPDPWKVADYHLKIGELMKSGIAFMEAGNYHQAITEFNKLIELEPLDHAAYNNRGEAHLKLGNYQQAREDFNRAIIAYNKVGGDLDLNMAEFCLQTGVTLTEKLRVALETWPKHYRNRGLAYEKLGNKTQAIEDMKKAAQKGDKEAQKYLLSKEMTW